MALAHVKSHKLCVKRCTIFQLKIPKWRIRHSGPPPSLDIFQCSQLNRTCKTLENNKKKLSLLSLSAY